ncbi:GFA family protein [Sphingomonas sp. MA1305]|uniref:GFA family protein n=1 Tax=unclassified Sphingomonas TaxID=196159 RepID=UPI001E5FA46B|nr:GFA family protein [Sphingomonas sp. MA1305]MBI0475123.1 GFA family protein [Sphingomonas sp. MA1305]
MVGNEPFGEDDDAATIMAGGCQCGRIRYALIVRDDEAYLCHCRMCQRATGGVAAALKAVAAGDLRWAGAEPDRYRSSPFARRGFCAACGTPLTYEPDDGEGLDVTVGSLDDPSRFRPVAHAGVESWHTAWLDTRDLPTQRTDQNSRITNKWIDSLGRIPD